MSIESDLGLPVHLTHKLVLIADKPYGRYKEIHCNCGLVFHELIKKNGKASSRTVRFWSAHLATVDTPNDVFIEVGSWKGARGWNKVSVLTFFHPEVDTYYLDGKRGGYSRFGYDRMQRGEPVEAPWMVGIEAHTGKRRNHGYAWRSKADAVDAAVKMLDVKKLNYDIKWAAGRSDGTVTIVSNSMSDALAALLTETDKALASDTIASLNTISERLAEIETYHSLVVAKRKIVDNKIKTLQNLEGMNGERHGAALAAQQTG